jgi:hypothetical protein
VKNFERSLLQSDEGIGNHFLYDLCEKGRFWDLENAKAKEYLSAEIWIIGRSYAASPERHRYAALKGTKIDYDNRGNGMSDFLDVVAGEILSNSSFVAACSSFEKESSKPYLLDSGSSDLKILSDSIELVAMFNNVLRESIFQVDKTSLVSHVGGTNAMMTPDGLGLNNFHSFASKLLNFNFPNAVFIHDSYSTNHLSTKEKTLVFKDSHGDVGDITIDLKDPLIDYFMSLNSAKIKCTPYVRQCIVEYLILCKAKNDISFTAYYPRAVDTYVMVLNR